VKAFFQVPIDVKGFNLDAPQYRVQAPRPPCVSSSVAASPETVSTLAPLLRARLTIVSRASKTGAVREPHPVHGPGPETKR
jgi:hypothetical protein